MDTTQRFFKNLDNYIAKKKKEYTKTLEKKAILIEKRAREET